jgi:hypothetical protein
MVGTVRFELTTSSTPRKRATKLRYVPTRSQKRIGIVRHERVVSIFFRVMQESRDAKANRNRSFLAGLERIDLLLQRFDIGAFEPF